MSFSPDGGANGALQILYLDLTATSRREKERGEGKEGRGRKGKKPKQTGENTPSPNKFLVTALIGRSGKQIFHFPSRQG